MAALTTKFPSRRTVSRLSRAEVESRIADMGVTLPPISTRLPFWFDDIFDPWCIANHDDTWCSKWYHDKYVLKLPTCPEEVAWYAAHERRKADWAKAQATAETAEHPAARESLFRACLTRAVQREGLEVLNKIIKTTLMDASTAKGCEVWTPWRFRNATRPQKEAAVIELLSQREDTET